MPGPQLYDRRLLAFTLRAAHVRPLQGGAKLMQALQGGGVPDAPRRLAPPSFPGLPPAETPAAANTRGGVKTPPYGPNH